MKKIILPTVLLAVSLSAQENSSEKPTVDPIFQVTSKVERNLFKDGTDDNVDDFWGRVGFGSSARMGNFTGEVIILAYPSGFGYELMRGIQTSADTAALNDGTEKVARFDVHSAFVTHKGEHLTLGIGRSILFNTNGAFFGNYIDEGPGGYFTGKGVYGNFVKFDFDYRAGTTSFAIGSGDSKLNTGYLRFFQNFALAENGNIGLGVRTDVLNKVHTPDSAALWNASAQIDYTFKETVKLYAEVGVTDMKKDSEAKVPVLVGVSFPAGKVLDAVAVEAEYVNEENRQNIEFEGTVKKESPIMLGLDLKKSLNDHFALNAGLYTLRELSEMRGGIALNISL